MCAEKKMKIFFYFPYSTLLITYRLIEKVFDNDNDDDHDHDDDHFPYFICFYLSRSSFNTHYRHLVHLKK